MSMRIKIQMMALALFFTGCAMTSERNDTALKENAQRALNNYRDCMFDAVAIYAPSDASAFEIAEAAQGRCGQTFYVYKSAIQTHFLSLVSGSGRSQT